MTGPDTLSLVKGHGTENDFLVLVDDDGSLGPLSGEAVAALCDRRSGIGADGLLRAVRPGDDPEAARWSGSADWFMDYRNADGGTAEMCGNGIRVMAEVLRRRGLAGPVGVRIGTRSGDHQVVPAPDGWAVVMGPVRVGVPDGSSADAAPGDDDVDTLVAVPGLGDPPRPGLRVRLGNPHVVVAVTGPDELAALDLTDPPALRPQPAQGANVEFVAVLGHDRGTGAGRVAMRVHERGSGETRSCGTGAVAAAAAAAEWGGSRAPRSWLVDVPGGRLQVDLPDGRGGSATLTGSAVVVADVEVDRRWLTDRLRVGGAP
jgi:diaminopimelate epimerase